MARAMKDSGIEWIGEIPEGWETVRLKDIKSSDMYAIVDGPFGTAISTSDYVEVGTPLVRIVNLDGDEIAVDNLVYITNEHAQKLLRSRFYKGDIIFAKTGATVGKCAINSNIEEGILSSSCVKIQIADNHYNRYFYYFFSTKQFNEALRMACNGTTRDTINLKPFSCLNCPLPPNDQQHIIADYLDNECARIDAVIEQTRASIEEYKKLKQSVITQAVTKGIRPGRKMKDSGVEWIGEIPEEWAVRPLKSFIDILPGYAFSSDDFNTDQGVRLLRGINVAPGSIRWDDVVYWNKEITDQIRQFELKEGDLVVGLDRPWISDGTRAAFVQERDLPCLLLQRVCRIRPNKDTDIRFVYHAIVGKSFEEALSTDTTGVSVPHISTKQIQQYLVAFPCKEEQMEISDFIDEKSANIDALIQKKQQFLAELESYKKSLIFEYVTGKKEVPG